MGGLGDEWVSGWVAGVACRWRCAAAGERADTLLRGRAEAVGAAARGGRGRFSGAGGPHLGLLLGGAAGNDALGKGLELAERADLGRADLGVGRRRRLLHLLLLPGAGGRAGGVGGCWVGAGRRRGGLRALRSAAAGERAAPRVRGGGGRCGAAARGRMKGEGGAGGPHLDGLLLGGAGDDALDKGLGLADLGGRLLLGARPAWLEDWWGWGRKGGGGGGAARASAGGELQGEGEIRAAGGWGAPTCRGPSRPSSPRQLPGSCRAGMRMTTTRRPAAGACPQPPPAARDRCAPVGRGGRAAGARPGGAASASSSDRAWAGHRGRAAPPPAPPPGAAGALSGERGGSGAARRARRRRAGARRGGGGRGRANWAHAPRGGTELLLERRLHGEQVIHS